MPTVIDSLIVELGLDPKSFDAGAREAVRKVDDLEKKAAASATAYNNAVARGVVNLFNQLNRQAQQARQSTQTHTTAVGNLFGRLNQQTQQAGGATQAQTRTITGLFAAMGRVYQSAQLHMNNAAQSARRGGQMIASGASQGTSSLQALASAGLTAYASLKTVQTMLLSTQEAAEKTAATGRRALSAGMGGAAVNRFGALAIAARETVGANPAQVEAEMAELNQAFKRAQDMGVWDPRFTRMMQTLPPGTLSPADQRLPMDELLDKIGVSLQSKPTDERIAWATAQGFSQETAQFLALPTDRRRRATAVAQQRAPTEDQVRELDKLRERVEIVRGEYESLWRVLVTRFSKSGLSDALEGFAALLAEIQKNETALKAIEVALGVGFAGAIAIAINRIGRVGQILLGLGSNPGAVFLSRLFGAAGILAGPGAFLYGLMGRIDPKSKGIPADESALPGAGRVPTQEEVDRYQRNLAPHEPGGVRGWWRQNAPRWLGGNYLSPKEDPRGKADKIRAAAVRHGHDPDVMLAVARKEGLLKYSGDNDTSFGAFQLHVGGGLGDEYYKQTGRHPSDPANEDDMIEWTAKNLARTGWGPYHGAAKAGVTGRMGIGTGAASASGAGASVLYANQRAVRNLPVQASLEVRMKEAAETLYGPGARVVVGSGGQPASGPNRVGTHSHDIDPRTGRGQAADVKVYYGSGQQVTGAELSKMGQYWLAKKYGGVGLRMEGDALHLDEHRARSWFYEGATPADRLAAARGRRGEMPAGSQSQMAAGLQSSLTAGGAITAAMQASRAAIMAGQGWSAAAGTTNTSYNRDTSIGSVNIHTQATDAQGIARDIRGALDRNLTAADANMGLEY